MRKLIVVFVLACAFTIIPDNVYAQDPTPTATPEVTATSPLPGGPTYLVQSGDTLTIIASRFGVRMADLMTANGMTDADQLAIGQPLVIPGLEGFDGYLLSDPVNYGDTLRTLSRQNQVPVDVLKKLNKITSPSELFAGTSLTFPKPSVIAEPLMNHAYLAPGQSLLELAVANNSNPWTLKEINYLNGSWAGIPNDTLFTNLETGQAPTSGLPPAFKSVDFSLPVTQGKTAVITVNTDPGVTLNGTLVDKPLKFFLQDDGSQVALQGVHALLTPGPYPLKLVATLSDGSTQAFEQNIMVSSGFYSSEDLYVDESYIDPAVTVPENEQLFSIVEPATPEKYWNGIFTPPSVYPDCFTSWYGTRRSYNDSPYDYFHTGVDFCGGEGLPILAPADGVVVFAGPLTVRGNATIIDHGHGIYSGFWHQSEILVQSGEKVAQGQEIGKVGGTGRVTGAHLHWEIIANGVQVDPEDWLANVYP